VATFPEIPTLSLFMRNAFFQVLLLCLLVGDALRPALMGLVSNSLATTLMKGQMPFKIY
jgi:hypothetical protein